MAAGSSVGALAWRGRAASTAAMAALTAAALVGMNVNVAPQAQASCASVFGFSTDPASCVSGPLGIAVALGEGATAHAKGVFSVAVAAGQDASATVSEGALNLAVQIGTNGEASSSGIAALAVQLGDNGVVDAEGIAMTALSIGANGGRVGAGLGFLSLAVNLARGGSQPEDIRVAAIGSGNFALNLFGRQETGGNPLIVIAEGAGNVALNIGGSSNVVKAGQLAPPHPNPEFGGGLNLAVSVMQKEGRVGAGNGYLNAALGAGGQYSGTVAGVSESPNTQSVLNAAFSVLSTGRSPDERNTVSSGPGPLAIAGSIGQQAATVVQDGPGVNINRSSSAALRASSALSSVTPNPRSEVGSGPTASKATGRGAVRAAGIRR